jgi:hypothetical protein
VNSSKPTSLNKTNLTKVSNKTLAVKVTNTTISANSTKKNITIATKPPHESATI